MGTNTSMTEREAKIEINDFQSDSELNSFIAVLFLRKKKGDWQPIEFTLIHVSQRVPKKGKLKQRIWIMGSIMNHWRDTLQKINSISIIQEIDTTRVDQSTGVIDPKPGKYINTKFVGHFPIEFEFRNNNGMIISCAQQEIFALNSNHGTG